MILLILSSLVLVVPAQKPTSSPAQRILPGWFPNACTLVICDPPERDPKELEVLRTHVSVLEAQLKALQMSTRKTHRAFLGYIFPNSTNVGAKTFATNGAEADFQTAKEMCEQFGGQIASPRNEEENNAVLKLATMFDKHAFLGMNDQETEGIFKHLNGDPMEYSNWAKGEPNGEHEDCIEMYLNAKWNDNTCDKHRLIMCEF
ncbi:pulmonary surfactant-associated protein D-like [Anolis sagrei]|uniref:pulmonary surfactant-associated protein D-like n=1 Tax=Anolis sagrei TaxID=38937 RepID=UPI003521B37F